MNYRIISNNTSLGTSGDTISDNDLLGLNVAALVTGGHIEPIVVKPTNKDKDKD